MFAKLKTLTTYFSKFELALWSGSIVLIWLSFLLFDRERYLTLTASCIGVTSLILNAKGNPLGQFLTIIFSVLYGIISFSCAYYGEMITYLGMTAHPWQELHLFPGCEILTKAIRQKLPFGESPNQN